MAKSAQVCRMAIESLCQGYKRVRLWTFTVPDTVPPRITAGRWSKCQRDLVRALSFQAVRVFELHPGGHGLHVHAVTPHFYPVDAMRVITTLHRFGRINVANIPADRAEYVCKYLSKQFWRPYKELSGMRLWACVGKNEVWRGVSCKNVVYDSPSTSIFRTLWGYLDLTDRASFRELKRLSLVSDMVANGMAVARISGPLGPFSPVDVKIEAIPLFRGVPRVVVGGRS